MENYKEAIMDFYDSAVLLDTATDNDMQEAFHNFEMAFEKMNEFIFENYDLHLGVKHSLANLFSDKQVK